MFCNNCGHKNPSNSNFCGSCGKPLEREEVTMTLNVLDALNVPEAQEVSLELADLSSSEAMLVVRGGTAIGSRFVLDADLVTVGRHPDNAIFLDDVTVSRRHAEFVRNGQSFVVRDVGSLNGTYVNGTRVDSAPLNDGDEVRIGAFKLIFLAGQS